MRAPARVALVAAVVSGLTAALAPVGAAPGPGSGWVVEAEPSASTDVRYFMHKRVEGHRGNWHVLSVRVQQDDDGVTGELLSLRCPTGSRPDPASGNGDFVQVGVAGFVDPDYSIAVSWSPGLSFMRITRDIVLEDYLTGEQTPTSINLHLRGSGELIRTVTRESYSDPDPWEYKQIDRERDGVTARGWLGATPTPITFARPLHVYEAYSRGYADGV